MSARGHERSGTYFSCILHHHLPRTIAPIDRLSDAQSSFSCGRLCEWSRLAVAQSKRQSCGPFRGHSAGEEGEAAAEEAAGETAVAGPNCVYRDITGGVRMCRVELGQSIRDLVTVSCTCQVVNGKAMHRILQAALDLCGAWY